MTSMPDRIKRVAGLLRGRRVLVLSGAGVSTESGIPDYRGPRSAARRIQPMYYREFVGNPAARARYWARSAVGWPRVSRARPNSGHAALAEMERSGAVIGLVTQNVDRLHQAAGSKRVVELHGALADVVCLECGTYEQRQQLQERLLEMNPGWAREQFRAAVSAPDGDAQVELPADGPFRVPACLRCTGVLKPDVVFFGESVPRRRVEEALALLGEAEALLVVGSSLAVYSGYRFAVQAHEVSMPVAIINIGPCRADPLATVRMEAALGETLPPLARLLDVSLEGLDGAGSPQGRS
jgi:NAD-dependent protein deacetylase/lipoamidase sirtuin 4